MDRYLGEPLLIDPRVGIVFQAVFADPSHEAIRVDFLSAVLGLDLREARVLSPFGLAGDEADKAVVIDVLARDDQGRTYQIEMQRRSDAGLPQRMLCGWSRLYTRGLARGAPYSSLKPVIGVWICERDLFADDPRPQLRFEVREAGDGRRLHDDLRIEVLQLRRWAAARDALLPTPAGRWFWFFNEAAGAEIMPEAVVHPALEEAMGVLKTFRADDELAFRYRRREAYEREMAAYALAEAEAQRLRVEIEQSRQEAERARQETERSRLETERAQQEAADARAMAAAAEQQRLALEAELRALRERGPRG
jgi:predicted transposase/invertase (TIGR01784 family)